MEKGTVLFSIFKLAPREKNNKIKKFWKRNLQFQHSLSELSWASPCLMEHAPSSSVLLRKCMKLPLTFSKFFYFIIFFLQVSLGKWKRELSQFPQFPPSQFPLSLNKMWFLIIVLLYKNNVNVKNAL